MEIKPCPFCGSEDLEIPDCNDVGSDFIDWVQCRKCGGGGPIYTNSKDEAIQAWNKRVE